MSDELQPGSQFGSYALEVRLGGGGFGSVWRAKDSTSGETVALKILVGKFSSGDVGRIRSEVELLAAAASSDSPNVVRVLGGGTEPSPHVVMEFIDGHDLEHELEQRTKLPQDETLRIVRAVAEALAVLEKAGIIHRDVKPANVMLADDGTIKLTDFGIAKIAGYESVTATGQLPLSAAYAAPEVWGGEATYQSDFYALGAVAFQCLTGSRPFAGTFVQLYEYHKTRPPDWALLPGETVPALRQLMVSCLAKEPGERPANSAALLALVEQADAELAQRTAEVAGSTAGHEPRALGPWLIESKHESQPWAFRCLHETSGERATVEVHFSDSLELGEQIKRAVTANPTLVPLGAERLLGTNRLILRPGETWPDRPPGQFMFWVARDELPAPRTNSQVTADQLHHTADGFLALIAASEAANLGLSVSVENTVVGAVSLLLRRPGLPPYPDSPPPLAALELLRSLPLDSAARSELGRARDLGELASRRADAVLAPAQGVATPATNRSEDARSETEVTSLRPAFTEVPPRNAVGAVQSAAPHRPTFAPDESASSSGTSSPTPLAMRSPAKRSRLARREVQGLAVIVFAILAALALALAEQGSGQDSANSSAPLAAGKFASVSAGGSHTCGVRTDGSVACWGQNQDGQATPPAGQFASVSAGRDHTCGVKIDGSVACWGNNYVGQATPAPGQFTTVAAAGGHNCGVTTDGKLVCWGAEYLESKPPTTGEFAGVSGGVDYTCGLETDGNFVCWGLDANLRIPRPSGPFTSISVGGGPVHACGVKPDATIVCWGRNYQGQATSPAGRFATVNTNELHTCGVKLDGSVTCWGENSYGQATPPDVQFASVSAGELHTCGVKHDGSVACWGFNKFGQATPPQ